MARGVFLSGLFFIVLSSLSSARNGGVKAEDSWLSQPQTSVSVVIGDVLHLKCEVFDNFAPGPVKWFLVEEPQWKLIYEDIQTNEANERITRDYPNSNTDFTISIRNVTLEDAGTYCCVKEKRDMRGSKVLLGGRGTQVVVEGIKAKDSRLWQPQRSVSVRIGDVLHLECGVYDTLTAGPVKWFLGDGPQRKLIYADTKTDERITRDSPGSNTIFTISIRNVTLEDAGTYYCVKEKKGLQGDKDWLKGRGTLVVVEVLQGQSIYGLYLGLFLNKVAMILFLLGLFQIKQHGCCLTRYLAKCRPRLRRDWNSKSPGL